MTRMNMRNDLVKGKTKDQETVCGGHEKDIHLGRLALHLFLYVIVARQIFYHYCQNVIILLFFPCFVLSCMLMLPVHIRKIAPCCPAYLPLHSIIIRLQIEK